MVWFDKRSAPMEGETTRDYLTAEEDNQTLQKFVAAIALSKRPTLSLRYWNTTLNKRKFDWVCGETVNQEVNWNDTYVFMCKRIVSAY
eukprot:scaffold9958_cov79-Cylindrotheca_fusiformis.AAC.1